MKVVKLETILANAGLRNYLFVRLTADNGLTGLGEASLEWQEKTVETLLHEWVEDRVLGCDPADVVALADDLIRDQYQGGSTVLTAISSIEIAMWDLLGKAEGLPVYQLLGGRARESLPVYANGWYGGARTPEAYAQKAAAVKAAGYQGLKFDPFGAAWKDLTREELDRAEALVASVRRAVGDDVELLVEGHGRLSVACAIEVGRRLAPYRPAFFEEPVTPHSLDQLLAVKQVLPYPVAAGERLYMLEEFERCVAIKAVDVLQPDLSHCGGLHIGRRIAALCRPTGIRLSPHCSVGPVALAAALHFGWATPEVWMQESFAAYDVPWRAALVRGWNPEQRGTFRLPDKPGLGLELDDALCLEHPYRKHSFPSLWDQQWLTDFTQTGER
jgi:galactonate dehydratase